MSNSRIPSPARSQGVISTPRRHRFRSFRSVGSPARSTTSVKLSNLVKEHNMDSFVLSPINTRRSVLTDNTDIEVPGRKSWWKRLEDNSRDLMVFVENKEAVDNIEDILDADILSQEKKNYTVDLPESSDGESISSIVIPQRKLFTQKGEAQKVFKHIMDNRENLAQLQRSNVNYDKTIHVGKKDLFNRGNRERSKPVFPAALLNISVNKTLTNKKDISKEGQVRNLFGNRLAAKRKNMFTEFIASESDEDIPDIQPKVFAFTKQPEHPPRRPSSTGRHRDTSPNSDVTDIEMDDWKLLPSSTMVENQFNLESNTPAKKARLSKLGENEDEDRNATREKSKQINVSEMRKVLSNSSKFKTIREFVESPVSEDERMDQEVNIEQNGIENRQNTPVRLLDVEPDIGNVGTRKSQVDEEDFEFILQYDEDERDGPENLDVPDNLNEADDDTLKEIKTTEENKIGENITMLHRNKLSFEAKTLNLSAKVIRTLRSSFNKGDEEIKSKNKSVNVSTRSDGKEKSNKLNDDHKAVSDLANAKVTRSLRSSLNKTNEELQNKSVTKNRISSGSGASQEFIESNDDANDMLRIDRIATVTDMLEASLNKTNKEVNSKNKSLNINNVSTRSSAREKSNELNNYEEAVLDVSGNAKVTRSLRSTLNKTNEEAQKKNKSVNKNNVSTRSDGTKELNESENDTKDEVEEAINATITNSLRASFNKTNKAVQSKNKSLNGNNVSLRSNPKEKYIEMNDDEQDMVEVARNANNIYIDKESFFVENREKGSRKTSIRLNELRPSLAPLRESTGISDGTRDSSTERSGWDSHRTTRKTLRQTFGRDFTPRKSLRALVMEKSAKRQTQGFNVTSKTPLASSTKLPDNLHLSARDDNTTDDDIQQEPSEQLQNDQIQTASNVAETSKNKNLSRVSTQLHLTNVACQKLQYTDIKEKYDDKRNSNYNEDDGENLQNNEKIDESEENDNDDAGSEEEMTHPQDVEEIDKESDSPDLQRDEESPQGVQDNDTEILQDSDVEEEESGEEMRNSQDVVESKESVDDQDKEETTDTPNVEEEEEDDVLNSHSIEDDQAKSNEEISNAEDEGEIEKTKDSQDVQDDEEIRDSPDIDEDDEAADSQDVGNEEADSEEEMENSRDNETEENKEERLISHNSTTNLTAQRYSINNDTEQSTNIDESNHDISRMRRHNALEAYLQKMRQQNLERRRQTEEAIRNSLKAPRDTSDIFKVPFKPVVRRLKSSVKPRTKSVKTNVLGIENLPPELLEDMKYKPPRRYQPPNASWITKRLYKYLEAKLEPKYDYKARVRAEKLAEMLFEFAKEARRRSVAEERSVQLLKLEMARLGIVSTHFEFYQFFHEFMPREIRVKVVPDVVNKISMPKDGIFSNIIR